MQDEVETKPILRRTNMDRSALAWHALVLACKDPRSDDELQEFVGVLRDPGFHLGEMIEQAMRHRLSYRVSAIFNRVRRDAGLPPSLVALMREGLHYNQNRLRAFRQAAAELAAALEERGIAFAFTKGLALESTVYRGEGTRHMNDVDLMIAPESREAVRDVLLGAGYATGDYNWDARRLEPLRRTTEVMYQMFPDHLPKFLKVLPDPVVPPIAFDVANSLTWHTSDWQVPVSAALARVERFEAGGARLPRMSWDYSFLFLVLHFFREAWFVEHIGDGKDVTLAKVADLHLSWKHHREEILAAGLRERIAEHALQAPAAWVLAHVDRTLGSTMLAEVGLEEHAGPEWLASLHGGSAGRAVCAVSMEERLRSTNRRTLVVEPAR
jgi:hypothetical protein